MLNKFKNMTLFGKLIVVVAVFAVLYFGISYGKDLIPKPVKESKIVQVNDLPPLPEDMKANAPFVAPPSSDVSNKVGGEIRAGIMAWNAQSGIIYANGGPVTTEGSFMEQQGVRLKIVTQNNCNEQANQLYAFAKDYAAGNVNTTKGYHFIAWMGDGVPAYITGLNEQIKKELGEEYIAQVFYAGGLSYGEDKFLGPPSAKRDPQSLRGSLVVGVLLDGDWNIAMKYCSDNQIPVNNDPTTYDPNALNWMAADDYIKAAQAYIAGIKEKRPIVVNGKRTGRDTTVQVNAVVTWTPGDVMAVEQKGGLVNLASTKDYSAQMPNTWIGIKKYLQDNRKKVEGFILAAALGGDQVKSHSTALTHAAQLSALIYQDDSMTPADWEKYYKGFKYTDNDGNIVELGGSRVWNLADNARYFGLEGGVNKYEAVYNTFAQIAVESYPEKLPAYQPLDEVLDLSYLTSVYTKNKNNNQMTVASAPTFKEGETISQLVSSKAVTIEFQTGSAVISPSSAATLRKILNDLIIADNLLVEINGHTDSQGDDALNLELSKARAEAVKQWLLNQDDAAFKNKITAQGYGETQPVGDNSTSYGRQKNRRVEVKLGR